MANWQVTGAPVFSGLQTLHRHYAGCFSWHVYSSCFPKICLKLYLACLNFYMQDDNRLGWKKNLIIISFSFLLKKYIYLFIWLHRILVMACRLSCSEACGILVSWPGIKPASPALQVAFSISGPSGKSLKSHFWPVTIWVIFIFSVVFFCTSQIG